MMVLDMVILVVGLLLAIEGFFVSLFPEKTKKIISSLIRNKRKIRSYGIMELIVGLILIGISVLIMNS